jgi:hypothetical protein
LVRKVKVTTVEEAKKIVLELLAQGQSTRLAMNAVDRLESTYRQWTHQDPTFREEARKAKEYSKDTKVEVNELSKISFEDFSNQYLNTKLWPHQLNWVDILEGKTPRWLHPAMTYEPANPRRILINTPPHHGKSTTLTVNYVVYKIVTNPNFRVVIVSKTREQARAFLLQIKGILEDPAYTKMQVAFGPPKGYKEDSITWSADRIHFGRATGRDSGEKDSTVQALGVGSGIYGYRSDLILLDDVVSDANAHEWPKHLNWLAKMVITRVKTGILAVVGTRVEAIDLYKVIRDPKQWSGDATPFTYFAMPAVLEFYEDKKDWVCLWPETEMPDGEDDVMKDNGMYAMWDGPALFSRRSEVPASAWAMVYQQEDVSSDAIFNSECVLGSVQGTRRRGALNPHAPGHPKDISSLYTVISLDPAMTGASAFVAQAYNRADKKIYILDCVNMIDTTPAKIRALVEDWVVKYKAQEFIVEINAHQKVYALDDDLRQWLSQYGCQLKPHFTGKQKWDVSFGVASMATLFGTLRDGRFQDNNTICLPSNEGSEGIKTLVGQLITWKPETKNPTDCVMALWFGIIRIRELMQQQSRITKNSSNRWSTPAQRSVRQTVNLDELEAERWAEKYG